MWRTEEELQREATELLKSIQVHLGELEELLQSCSGNWGYEDPVYRFYHQSFKVYCVQEKTQEIVAKLQALAPHLPLNAWFLEIVQQGTRKTFSPPDNENWTAATRPIVEAFFHARFFLEMICKYGRQLQSTPTSLPSGWAAVLYLYRIR